MRPISDKAAYIMLAAVFILSRIIFHLVGIQFEHRQEVAEFIQYLDPAWLQHDLLASLLYLHAQPPLFNLLLGGAFKLAGEQYHLLLQGVFLLFGLGINLLLLATMRALGVGRWLALSLACLYCIAPSQILYENHLFYVYPLTFLLTLLTYLAVRLCRFPTGRSVFAFFLTLAALCLTRSAYHLVLFLPAFLLAAHAAGLRRAALCGLLPLLLVAGWYGKNLVLFDQFSASSWGGISLARVTIGGLTPDQRAELAAQGHAVVRHHYFQKPDLSAYLQQPPPAGPQAYTARYKANGTLNYNHYSFIPYGQDYAAAAAAALRQFPENYLANIASGFTYSFAPTERYPWVKINLDKLGRYADIYDSFVWLSPYLAIDADPALALSLMPGLTFLFLFPVAAMCVLRVLVLNPAARAHIAPLAFILLMIGYCYVGQNLVEAGENNRFRMEWEPLLVLILALAAGWRTQRVIEN